MIFYSMAVKSMSTSSPVQSGIFFFLFLLDFEWQVKSALATFPSICSVCLKVPSSSWSATTRGPRYRLIPFWPIFSCFSSSSTVFLSNFNLTIEMNVQLHRSCVNLPFPIENELQTEVRVSLSSDPTVYEALHVLAGNSENCFCKDGG